MFKIKSEKLITLRTFINRNRSLLLIGSMVGGLWAVALFAATDLWRTEVPSIKAAGARAPVRIVIAPAMYHRSRAADSRSASIHPTKPVNAGIRKRRGVQLTPKQSRFVQNLGQYLHTQGQTATVTSGARSPQHQLAIIKSKVRGLGASGRFPELTRASVSKPSTWLKAWQWLRARHVPVYAPAAVPGVEGETSNHIKGLAVDLIGSSLDHLSSLVAKFAHSSLAMHSPLRILSIAREPGCVHVNLGAK